MAVVLAWMEYCSAVLCQRGVEVDLDGLSGHSQHEQLLA